MLPLPAFFCTLQCDSILLAEPLFEVVNGFLECHGLRIRVLLKKRMRKIRRALFSRKTEVCTSVVAMPVKTYKTYKLRPNGNWPMSGIEMTETTRKALIM